MSAETLIGSYILRLSIKHSRWQIGLHDVRGGEAHLLSSFEDLARHLEHLSFQIIQSPGRNWNANGTPSDEDKPIQEDIVLPTLKKEPQKD